MYHIALAALAVGIPVAQVQPPREIAQAIDCIAVPLLMSHNAAVATRRSVAPREERRAPPRPMPRCLRLSAR